MHVEIKDKVDDLHEEWYTFRLSTPSGKLLLDSYKKVERKTRRHKFRPIKTYSRVGREPEHWETDKLSADDITLSGAIKKLAICELLSQIEVSM